MLHVQLMKTFHGISLRWILQYASDNKSSLVQVMAWCHEAPFQMVDKMLQNTAVMIYWVYGSYTKTMKLFSSLTDKLFSK